MHLEATQAPTKYSTPCLGLPLYIPNCQASNVLTSVQGRVSSIG